MLGQHSDEYTLSVCLWIRTHCVLHSTKRCSIFHFCASKQCKDGDLADIHPADPGPLPCALGSCAWWWSSPTSVSLPTCAWAWTLTLLQSESAWGKLINLPGNWLRRCVHLQVGEEGWQDLFPLLTECTAEKQCNTTGMFDHLKYLGNSNIVYLFAKQRTSNGKLRDWSNTYVNLQVVNGARIELEVSE